MKESEKLEESEGSGDSILNKLPLITAFILILAGLCEWFSGVDIFPDGAHLTFTGFLYAITVYPIKS